MTQRAWNNGYLSSHINALLMKFRKTQRAQCAQESFLDLLGHASNHCKVLLLGMATSLRALDPAAALLGVPEKKTSQSLPYSVIGGSVLANVSSHIDDIAAILGRYNIMRNHASSHT